MPIEIRPITADEVPAFRQTISRAFGDDPSEDDDADERFLAFFDLERTYVPFDGDTMVGASASFTFDVSLPGGTATPMGGLTVVAVKPTHRRRGILTGMIGAHFDDCAARGEVVSGLWASESSIYRRYGYGVAAPVHDLTIDASAAGVPVAPDEVRLITLDEARKVFPGIYDSVFSTRPGQTSRNDVWWNEREFRDPAHWRRGASERRYLAAFRGGNAVGYATYRQKAKWENSIANGSVIVGELLGVDSDARLSLWSLLCSIDLFPNVTADNQPPDLELPWQVANPRAIQRKELDGMYVRVLDVPGALEARRYSTSDRVTIEVIDAMGIADGTYELAGSPDGASCSPTTEPADVTMDAATLSALYLGADLVDTLARAGRIEGAGEDVARFGAMLRSPIAPHCPEVF
jgi:predicted acetyltransferase